MHLLAKMSNGAVDLLLGHSSPPCPSSLPLKLAVSRLRRLLIFAGSPRRSPFGRAENPAVAFAKISLQTLLERRFALTAQPGKPLSPDLKRAFGIAPRRA